MKKIMNLLLSLALIFSLTGCGKEQIATYSKTSFMDEISMTDSVTLTAKGDVLNEMNETITFDLSAIDSEIKEEMVPMYDEIYAKLKESAPSSVTVTYSAEGSTYVVNVLINLIGADLKELNDTGFIVLSSADIDKVQFVSFKQTSDAYVANGYTLQE